MLIDAFRQIKTVAPRKEGDFFREELGPVGKNGFKEILRVRSVVEAVDHGSKSDPHSL